MRRPLATLVEHNIEHRQQLILYKRDNANTLGTVNIGGATHLLNGAGFREEGALWYQRCGGCSSQQRARTELGGSGSGCSKGTLSLRVYLYQESRFAQQVGTVPTDIPPTQWQGGQMVFGPKRYSATRVWLPAQRRRRGRNWRGRNTSPPNGAWCKSPRGRGIYPSMRNRQGPSSRGLYTKIDGRKWSGTSSEAGSSPWGHRCVGWQRQAECNRNESWRRNSGTKAPKEGRTGRK